VKSIILFLRGSRDYRYILTPISRVLQYSVIGVIGGGGKKYSVIHSCW